jgi:hypothetical protein
MLYKALGFAVWKGARWYVARRLPSRRLMLTGALGIAIATAVAVGAKRDTSA